MSSNLDAGTREKKCPYPKCHKPVQIKVGRRKEDENPYVRHMECPHCGKTIEFTINGGRVKIIKQ